MQDAPLPRHCQSDTMDPSRAAALATTLGIAFDAKEPLPPFFHQIYFWDPHPASGLGRDGHPKVGGGIPDMGLPRRMWAGGRLAFHAPLHTGAPAEKRSICEAATRKAGRTGPLALITLRHDIYQNGDLCVTEWQDLVYRADPDPDAVQPAPPQAPDAADATQQIAFSSTDLFRYSALTFNGHRIHYDLPYAQTVEGYPGLVVHGPLLAQMLMLMAQKQIGPLAQFSFRATAPLMDFETAQFCRAGNTLWVAGPDGRQCMIADATEQSQ